MFALKLHHIGIVVQNINESLGELANFLSFESTNLPTLIGSQKVNICFLKTNNVYIELIEPAEENSPITNFGKSPTYSNSQHLDHLKLSKPHRSPTAEMARQELVWQKHPIWQSYFCQWQN